MIVAVGLLGACSAPPPTDLSTPAPAVSVPMPQVQPPATPKPSPTKAKPTTSPLSGRKGGVDTPVVVVKLDNTPSAQPHRNLVKADMVYVEPVEWGLTRLAAVYSTSIPKVAGPVRSARISDIDLFAPFGDIAFVFSGAQKRLLPKLAKADWTEVSPDVGSPGFHRENGTGRVAPYNLMAEPQRIVATSGATATAPDLGLTFSKKRPAEGSKVSRMTARWPASSVQFRWNADTQAFDVWFGGRQGRDTSRPYEQRASTVIVQYVKQTDSGYGDKFGGVTPLTVTTGKGKGVLLRDGRSWPIRWSKPSDEANTAYTDSSGKPIALAPGQVWIVLKDRSSKVELDR